MGGKLCQLVDSCRIKRSLPVAIIGDADAVKITLCVDNGDWAKANWRNTFIRRGEVVPLISLAELDISTKMELGNEIF